MARYNIKSIDLAQEMRISPNSVSNLRKGSTMPRLDGDSLNKLCNALNKLALDLDEEITPVTLIDYSRDNKPDNGLKTSTLTASSSKKTPKKVVSPETVNHPSVLTVIPGVKSA